MSKFTLLSILLISFLSTACKQDAPPDPGEEVPPPSITKFQQLETELGYVIEGLIPWSGIGLESLPTAGHRFGMDFLLTDDDDGGLKDVQLSWQVGAGADTLPIPADFGRFTLVKELSANGKEEILQLTERPEIDGIAEPLWNEVPAYKLSKLLTGMPEDELDFSGSFRAIWDTAALYLFLHVQDDKLTKDSRSLRTEDDGLAIMLDAKNTNSSTFDPKLHAYYRLLPGDLITYVNDFSSRPKWTIPQNEVFDGGPGKDGIPALLDPAFIAATEATYLNNSDLVLGIKRGNEVRAYPHKILDWHEIINDEIDGFPFAVTYCPLTGTGIGWEREVDGQITTFGVSGLLYNTNLIPYDRLTESNWTQIGLDCVNGPSQGNRAKLVQLVETSWKTWKEMYPDTRVVSEETGYGRDYSFYPYGNYRTDHSTVLFPISPDDDRLPRKTRVHGIIVKGKAKVYRLPSFEGGYSIINTTFQGEKLIVLGSQASNLVVSFYRMLDDGTELNFSVVSGEGEAILQDQEGNRWNVFGEALSGPRQGQRLTPTESFMGYWMAFGSFYPKPEI